ncbi:MAG: hypothetical protein AAGA54_12095 [Myxococcota bacterium]
MFEPSIDLVFRDELHRLVPGDIIGRGPRASLPIEDGRVSEAHGLISLRGGTLKLLALRGRFIYRSRPLAELDLAVGQDIYLAPELKFTVVALELPRQVLAVRTKFMTATVLSGVSRLEQASSDRLLPGYKRGAAAIFWNQDSTWLVTTPDDRTQVLQSGADVALGDVQLEALSVDVSQANAHRTHAEDETRRGVFIQTRFNTATIERFDGHMLHLNGVSARIVAELAAVAGPANWLGLAREIWPHEQGRIALRRKWDVSVARLRKKLRDDGISPTLIAADGCGNFELFLSSADRVEAHD